MMTSTRIASRSVVLALTGSVARPPVAGVSGRVHRALSIARASPEDADMTDMNSAQLSDNATIFYSGNSYTQQEWDEVVSTGKVKPAPESPVSVGNGEESMTLAGAFAFDKAPEIINGRLAMIAFVAALGAEISSGESVARQFGESSVGVVLTAVVFTAASLIPMLNGTKKESFGPFKPEAELSNGRAAMIGFAFLLIAEAVNGKAFF